MSKHQIQPINSVLTRDGRPRVRTRFSAANKDSEKLISPVQLTTSKIGSYTG